MYLLYLDEGVILLFNNKNITNLKKKRAEDEDGCLKTGSHSLTGVVNTELVRGSRTPYRIHALGSKRKHGRPAEL